jgi:hypothetical protein
LTVNWETTVDLIALGSGIIKIRSEEEAGGGRCEARRTDWMFCTDKDPNERWERFVQATVQVK